MHCWDFAQKLCTDMYTIAIREAGFARIAGLHVVWLPIFRRLECATSLLPLLRHWRKVISKAARSRQNKAWGLYTTTRPCWAATTTTTTTRSNALYHLNTAPVSDVNLHYVPNEHWLSDGNYNCSTGLTSSNSVYTRSWSTWTDCLTQQRHAKGSMERRRHQEKKRGAVRASWILTAL